MSDGTQVLSLQVAEHGIELSVAFDEEERAGLTRAHSFLVAFDHEEFGEDAKALVDSASDLAWEIHHNYKRQPKEAS